MLSGARKRRSIIQFIHQISQFTPLLRFAHICRWKQNIITASASDQIGMQQILFIVEARCPLFRVILGQEYVM
jgi:hypothetical protein